MIILDVDTPNSCRECFLSCQMPNIPPTGTKEMEYYDPSVSSVIICRKDYKIHTPMDKDCPIKGEYKEESNA